MPTRASMAVLLLCLASLAGCGSGDASPTAPIAATVSVSLPLPSLAVGSSELASVTEKYSNDSATVAPDPYWSSSNVAVAGVTSTGNVIAVGMGTDTIVAMVFAGRGQVVVTVTAAPPLPAGVLAINVQPGAVQSFPLDGSVTGYQIPAIGDSSKYVFIVADADSIALRPKSFGITMDSGAVTASSTVNTPTASPSWNIPTGRNAVLPGDAIEGHIRDYERTHLPRVSSRLTPSVRASERPREGISGSGARATNNYSTGEVATIRVPDLGGDLCNGYTTIGAKVLAVSTKAIVLMDTAVVVDTGATNAASQLAQEFDSTIYPTDTKYFGSPSDIDGNGKVMMLFTAEVNKQTLKNSADYEEGFFFAGDLFPTSTCKESNLGEIFYLLSPDPQGTFGKAYSAAFVEQISRGTVAHEFEHMINAGHRIALSAPFEDSWLDEGLAHFAEDLVGRVANNMSDTQIATRANTQANVNNYNAFFFQNIARYGSYLKATGTTGIIGDASSSLPVRGGAWSLLRNTADRYSGANVSAITQKLETSGLVGVPNIVAASGQSFSTLIGSWAVANAYSLLGVSGPLSYVSYNFGDLLLGSGLGPSSSPITQLTAGMHATSTVISADARYFQVTTSGASIPQTIHLVASSGTGAAVIPTSRLYVLRVQ